MKLTYPCHSAEHMLARRRFLAGMATAAAGSAIGGLDVFARPLAAAQLNDRRKRVVVFNMHGGLSQLESWDPKPGTETGGPFRAIDTSVPGIKISELLPNVARQMHRLCLVRGVNTHEDDHGKGAYMMLTGRRQTPAADYPYIGPLRQGDDPRRRSVARPHRHHPRRRRRSRQRFRLPRPEVLEHRPGQRQSSTTFLQARPSHRADGRLRATTFANE